MKILLLGGDGGLGSTFQEWLKKKKIAFQAPSRKELDITSKDQLQQFCKDQHFTHMINAAAYTAVDLAEKEALFAFQVNALALGNLVAVAREEQIKIVHFSTDYIFDGKKGSPYVEEDPPHPLNVYGISKWMGEMLLPKEALIIRTSWLFGHFGHNFVFGILQKLQQEELVKIVSDQKGRPTFCDDLVCATLQLLPYSGVFHFANEGACSWYEFALKIKEVAETLNFKIKGKIEPISSSEYKRAAIRPVFSVLETSKYESVTKNKIRHWEEGLKTCLTHKKP